MKKEYDFSKGKRGAVVPQKGKTRVTIYFDTEVVEAFRGRAEAKGMGYQTMINQVLREYPNSGWGGALVGLLPTTYETLLFLPNMYGKQMGEKSS